jgi:hypothetical protein
VAILATGAASGTVSFISFVVSANIGYAGFVFWGLGVWEREKIG